MKKYLLAFIFLFLFSGTLFCQMLDMFYPKAGYDFLKNNEAEINNYRLIGIMGIEQIDQPYLSVDFDKGTSSAWIYLYKAKDTTNHNMYMYIVMSLAGNFQAVPNIDSTGDSQTITALNDVWINTDTLFANVRQNKEFMDYYKNNLNSITAKGIILTFGEDTTFSPVRSKENNNMWMVTVMLENEAATCSYFAENGFLNKCDYPVLAVKEALEKILSVYPNPSSDRIRFDVPFTGQADLKITNLFGQVVKSETRTIDQSTDINITDLPSGTYIVRLTYGKNIYVNKLQVVR